MPSAPPAAGPSAAATPPWDQGQARGAAPQQPAMRQQQQESADDEPPSWVTEFSDDTAVAAEAPAVVAPPQPARVAAPSAPPHPYVVTPVPEIGCVASEHAVTFRLRVPVDTLRASGNSEKLAAALQEHFPNLRVTVDTEIGPVWYTAGAEQRAAREERQRQAEATVGADAFVQEMERTFGAFIVPGSVKPPAA